MRKVKHFDHDLYRAIRRERERLGLPLANLNERLENHELIGKKMHSLYDNCDFTVDYVHKQWFDGWYEVLFLIDEHNSHKVVYWKSIDCRDETILEGIADARAEMLFIDSDGRYAKELEGL